VAWRQCRQRAWRVDALPRARSTVVVAGTGEIALEQFQHDLCRISPFSAQLDDMAIIGVILMWNLAHAGLEDVHTVYLGAET
jgi:hypothetical protein